MEDEIKPDFNLQGSSLERINRILSAIDIHDIIEPKEIKKKFDLYRRLVNNVYKYMDKEEKIEVDKMLFILKVELNKCKTHQSSRFTYYADIFERGIQEFVHNKVKSEE